MGVKLDDHYDNQNLYVMNPDFHHKIQTVCFYLSVYFLDFLVIKKEKKYYTSKSWPCGTNFLDLVLMPIIIYTLFEAQ